MPIGEGCAASIERRYMRLASSHGQCTDGSGQFEGEGRFAADGSSEAACNSWRRRRQHWRTRHRNDVLHLFCIFSIQHLPPTRLHHQLSRACLHGDTKRPCSRTHHVATEHLDSAASPPRHASLATHPPPIGRCEEQGAGKPRAPDMRAVTAVRHCCSCRCFCR